MRRLSRKPKTEAPVWMETPAAGPVRFHPNLHTAAELTGIRSPSSADQDQVTESAA